MEGKDSLQTMIGDKFPILPGPGMASATAFAVGPPWQGGSIPAQSPDAIGPSRPLRGNVRAGPAPTPSLTNPGRHAPCVGTGHARRRHPCFVTPPRHNPTRPPASRAGETSPPRRARPLYMNGEGEK